MKINSITAHTEWMKLSKEEKRKITLQAVGFGFSDDNDEEFDINYLHVIACHYETEREHKQYLKMLDVISPFIVELCDIFESSVFKNTFNKLRRISKKIDRLIDKATD